MTNELEEDGLDRLMRVYRERLRWHAEAAASRTTCTPEKEGGPAVPESLGDNVVRLEHWVRSSTRARAREGDTEPPDDAA